jgi:hypothetical protein
MRSRYRPKVAIGENAEIHQHLSRFACSRAFAAFADASLEGFHSKYYYMLWRPFHS